MSKTIHKFPLQPTPTSIQLPVGSQVLCVKTQRGSPVLYALVSQHPLTEMRTFTTYGTGFDIRDNPGRYIGTFMLDGESLVFHVFEDTYP